MRIVIQRVVGASVTVNREIVGQIDPGWLVLLGIEKGDTRASASWLSEKLVHLRAFEDQEGKMNCSILDCGGDVLVVSQFTLAGDCRKGRRPSFDSAAPPDEARELYEFFCDQVARFGLHVEQGVFQADMQVSLVNDGPVTFVIDHKAP